MATEYGVWHPRSCKMVTYDSLDDARKAGAAMGWPVFSREVAEWVEIWNG